ncbi:MAG: hypothetical protein JWN52_6165 [Actinomycetia bacterium]|nr:hypothetical protein [Actinomycetes bacterium]
MDAALGENGGHWPQPVFSPEIPERDLQLLLGHRQALVPANRPLPPKVVSWNREPWTNLKVILHLQILSLLVLLIAGGITGAVFGELAGAVVRVLVIVGDLALTGQFAIACSRESPGRRAVRDHHGNYLCPEDFDDQSRTLLRRAQRAADSVLSSTVNTEGLLDNIGNAVVLPGHLWDIARLLQDQTKLRARQRAAMDGIMTPELQAVLGPQRQALDHSVAAVTRRIETLEVYAYRVSLVESAYRAQQLLVDNDDYVELLAKTGDQSALSDLTQRAQQVETTLKTSLNDAVEAGRTLATPAAFR